MTKVLFATDMHVPFEDPAAVELAMKIGEAYGPDIRIAGSDGLDFYSLSNFSKDPLRAKGANLQDDVYRWQRIESEWNDACPDADVHFLLGNHEIRLRRYVWDKAPDLVSLEGLNFENVLALDALGIKYEDFSQETNNQEVLVGALSIKHGGFARKHSGWSVKADLENEFYAINVLIGHSHRGAQVFVTTRNGLVKGVEGFCLCSLNPSYITGTPNWQQGIVLAKVDDRIVDFELIPFERSGGFLRTSWRDKEYRVKEY